MDTVLLVIHRVIEFQIFQLVQNDILLLLRAHNQVVSLLYLLDSRRHQGQYVAGNISDGLVVLYLKWL